MRLLLAKTGDETHWMLSRTDGRWVPALATICPAVSTGFGVATFLPESRSTRPGSCSRTLSVLGQLILLASMLLSA